MNNFCIHNFQDRGRKHREENLGGALRGPGESNRPIMQLTQPKTHA